MKCLQRSTTKSSSPRPNPSWRKMIWMIKNLQRTEQYSDSHFYKLLGLIFNRLNEKNIFLSSHLSVNILYLSFWCGPPLLATQMAFKRPFLSTHSNTNQHCNVRSAKLEDQRHSDLWGLLKSTHKGTDMYSGWLFRWLANKEDIFHLKCIKCDYCHNPNSKERRGQGRGGPPMTCKKTERYSLTELKTGN